MSREVKADYVTLIDFIKSYSIEDVVCNDFEKSLSSFHKKYYAYLTLIGEIQNNISVDSLKNLTNEQFSYLTESCSDIGTTFFNLFHGAYKSSKLILRSSIETFIKGFVKDEYNNVTNETSLYEIFRIVKTLPFFQSAIPKELIENIHNIYKQLCADVHTAHESHMERISALNHFPIYSKEEVEKITQLSSKLICNYTTLICIKFNSFYHQIHYKNLEIIKNGIEKKHRPLINNTF